MTLKVPHLNDQRFARIFVMRRAQRELAKFMDFVGPQTLNKLVGEKKSLEQLLPAQSLAEYKVLAAQYFWIANLLTDEDFKALLPPWCMKIVAAHGPEGELWLDQQLVWLRSLFTQPVDR